jgi:murein DD-endopeptidase MepM/ murein hydrolase activator NlpD
MPRVVRIPWPMRRHTIAKPESTPAEAPASEPAPDAPVESAPAPASDPPPLSLLPLTGPLRSPQFHNPMPGGVFAGYAGDTGLDLVGSPRTVHALAAATLDYAEKGHTRWTGPQDSPYCVRLTLDQPVAWKGHRITHVYYAHLSAVVLEQAESAKTKRHVQAGEPLGTSGSARGVPHLHLGLLLDGEVEQDDWTFILREGEVRSALGGYGNGETLPKT